ncbi:MAG: TonB-dependent receptor [Acidobacteria bacterium]|nr:TonB-dependent receptor [Acidobacteriota bacterium]
MFLCTAFTFYLGTAPARAQTTQIQGAITDETGGVLPGVNVTLTHTETGTSRVVVTDTRGHYLFGGIRVGAYEMLTELSGFVSQKRGITVLLGQSATVDLVMTVATLEQNITVVGETPLVDITQSDIASNLDMLQVKELPVMGRDWLNLTVVAPGVRSSSEGAPTMAAQGSMRTKVNVDGLQVNNATNFGNLNLELSQEAVREVQVLTNRFSAEYARAAGGVVNAVTKSGTNTFAGSFYSFFRNDKFNAKDFFTNQVEPFSDKQIGMTFGGPIVKDRLHFFGNWEMQRRPQTQTTNTSIPAIDTTYPIDRTKDLAVVRVDLQMTPTHRMGVRYAYSNVEQLNVSVRDHMSNGWRYPEVGHSIVLSSTAVPTDTMLNEFRAQFLNWVAIRYPNAPFPLLNFPGADLGALNNSLSDKYERHLQIHNDFSWNRGNHNLKLGGEYFFEGMKGRTGLIFFGDYLVPTNPTDWAAVRSVVEASDRAGLQRLVDLGIVPAPSRAIFAIGDPNYDTPIHLLGAYVQDDWKVGSRLTLNLGVRYDVEIGNWMDMTTRYTESYGKPQQDNNNFAPRLGFAYDINGKQQTVIRGGAGRYYDQIHQNIVFAHAVQNGDTYALVNVLYNRAPDFMVDPIKGITLESVIAGAPSDIRPVSKDVRVPYSDQYSIGLAHQLTSTLAIQADYIHTVGKGEMYSRNANVFTDPVTGEPKPVATFGRPDPRYGAIRLVEGDGRSRYEGLQMGLTKRFSDRFQVGGSYTLSWAYADQGQTHIYNTPEPTRPISELFGPSERDQRHRFVANGSVQMPFDVTVSGVFYAASGQRYATLAGRDVNRDLDNNDLARYPDGTKWPRVGGIGDPAYRLDGRVSKQFVLHGSVSAEIMVEAFNVFNHRNYATYNGNQSSAAFLTPNRSDDLNFQPRQGQIAFRLTF